MESNCGDSQSLTEHSTRQPAPADSTSAGRLHYMIQEAPSKLDNSV